MLEQAATLGAAALVAGRVTSCYGSRFAAMHNGVDIAAAIGTPIYAPPAGVVLDAGPAHGFGLAVYIQHPDGTITVQSVLREHRAAGRRRTADRRGRQSGQSTGPHLHIETHRGGLYQDRVNPTPWLAHAESRSAAVAADRCSHGGPTLILVKSCSSRPHGVSTLRARA